jgi:hypothetical protein
MRFLIDYNLQKYGAILLGKIANDGWLDLISLSFVFFQDVNLSPDSSDRLVWRFAQENQMVLLTANRNMKGADSLEQVFREENTPDPLPIITIANLDRFSREANYRSQCADLIIEIVLAIENYRGVGRIYIP